MGFSAYLRNKLLDHAYGGGDYTRPATVYVSLHTADPGDTGATEASGGGYARLAVTNNATNFPASSAGAKANGTLLTLFTASGAVSSGSNMTHVGVWDASSGGNFMGGGALSVAKPIASGDVATVPIGDLDLTLT